MADRKEILSQHGSLKSKKDPEIPAFQAIAKLMAPDDGDFDDPTIRRDRDDADLFDSTLIYAHEDQVGGLFSQGANPATRWFEVGVADPDAAKWGPIKDYNTRLTQMLYASLSPAASTFYENVPQWFGCATAFGTGFLAQEEWPERQMLLDTAMPLSQMFKDVDAAGNTDKISREWPMTGRQIKQRWKVDEKQVKDGDTYRVVQLVYPNDAFRPGELGWRGAQYLSCVVCETIPSLMHEKHFYELPYHEIGWRKRAGRVWARGAGHATRHDGNMLQEMERTGLVAAQFDAEPMLLTRNDTDITAADHAPSAILEGGMGDQGKPNAQFLERKSRMQLAEMKMEARRVAIRKAFRFSIETVQNRPQMTAFEFAGWQQQELRLMAPNLIQLQSGLASFIARRFRILQRAEQLPPPPRELANMPLTIEFISPLAKAQKLASAQSTIQYLGYIDQQIAQTGDPSIGDVVDRDKAHRKIGEAMLEEQDILRGVDAVEKIRQMRAQAQQQQQQLEHAGQAAEIAATVAHAKQAGSLAEQRKGA